MWVFLNNAFLSIVDPPETCDDLLVRARIRGDIERIFPEAVVEQIPMRDYAYRALVPRKMVANAMREAVLDIGYGNFKNSVEEDSRHSAYARVWGVMNGLQWELKGRTLARFEADRKIEWDSRISSATSLPWPDEEFEGMGDDHEFARPRKEVRRYTLSRG
jgi:hypothetical protein